MAYHLMVDSVVQPGAYHGLPIELPTEAHQTIMAANSVAEATAVDSFPGENLFVKPTSEVLAAHERYRYREMDISDPIKELLLREEIALLVKHGAWLEALANRVIPPLNMTQVQFIKVADRTIGPVAPHEIAWISFTVAKELAA